MCAWLGRFTSAELTALTWGDIQLSEQGLVLLVRASKTCFWVMCGMLRCGRLNVGMPHACVEGSCVPPLS